MEFKWWFLTDTFNFIPDAWKGDGTYTEESWPASAVLLTDEEAAEYRGTTPPEGKILGTVDGRPSWIDRPIPPPPTVEEMLAAAVAKRDSLLAVATKRIGPLQDAVDLGDPTLEEEALLIKWKTYRRDVNRVSQQTSYPSAIDWPAEPA